MEGRVSVRISACGYFGCTSLTPNPDVNGTVSITNNGAINAPGYGIYGFNFGNGDVSIQSNAPVTASGAGSQGGIYAFTAETGNITVTTTANVTIGQGFGIQTVSAGHGTTTINVNDGMVQGGSGGIDASSASGAIRITNTGTVSNTSGQPGDPAVATSGVGAATLTNNTGALLAGTVSMTGTGTSNFNNAGIWSTLGPSTFAGGSRISNTGTIDVVRHRRLSTGWAV